MKNYNKRLDDVKVVYEKLLANPVCYFADVMSSML